MAKAKRPAKDSVEKKTKHKKPKVKTIQFYGFNIKIQSNDRKGEGMYYSLIQSLYGEDVIGKISPEKAMMLRTQFNQEVKIKNSQERLLYGKLVKFTLLEGSEWFNRREKGVGPYDAPKDIYPNAFETDYIFIPETHRFFVKKSDKLSVSAVKTFLENSLKQLVSSDENVLVYIMQSKDVIDRIIESESIKSLDIDLSYTNDDIGDLAQELMDDLLKEGFIGSASFKLRPNEKDELNSEAKMVRGLLEVAKDNGTVTARIVEEGKKQTIKTKDHPEVIPVPQTENNELEMRTNLLQLILQQYRNYGGS